MWIKMFGVRIARLNIYLLVSFRKDVHCPHSDVGKLLSIAPTLMTSMSREVVLSSDSIFMVTSVLRGDEGPIGLL